MYHTGPWWLLCLTAYTHRLRRHVQRPARPGQCTRHAMQRQWLAIHNTLRPCQAKGDQSQRPCSASPVPPPAIAFPHFPSAAVLPRPPCPAGGTRSISLPFGALAEPDGIAKELSRHHRIQRDWPHPAPGCITHPTAVLRPVTTERGTFWHTPICPPAGGWGP